MSEKSTEAELVVIEQKHLRWLCNEEGGERTDLRGAHLRRADLRGTDLQGALLHGADLTEADLRGTDLTEANLNGARTETEEEAQNEARNGRD